MLRRVKMVMPLLFAFFLTLLPFLLLEYTQFQRLQVQNEREQYLWEQQANNYLQLFSNLNSYQQLLRRKMGVFRERLMALSASHGAIDKLIVEDLERNFPGNFRPELLYAGKFKPGSDKFELFRGKGYCSQRLRIFSTILSALGNFDNLSESKLKLANNFCEGALGEGVDVDFLYEYRRGKLNGVKLEGRNYLLLWDMIDQPEKGKIVYFCFFDFYGLKREQTVRIAQRKLEKHYPDVLSALIPIEESAQGLKPIFERRLNNDQVELVKKLAAETRENTSRAEVLPVGKVVNIAGYNILRQFVDVEFPYEILLMRKEVAESHSRPDMLIFTLRLAFFSMWFLALVKVLITAMPLGLSISNWLTLIFMVVGILPLVVLYIAGAFHLESSAFRQEQQSLRTIIRQFEEVDVSSEGIISQYREFCRNLEMRPSWKAAMKEWNLEAWKKEVEKLPAMFEKAGLNFSAIYIYPPPISRLDHFYHNFSRSSNGRDKSISEFYKTWVEKAYFKICPEYAEFKDTEMPFFAGEEGNEILRLFMGNRADSDLVDLGDQKQFFYQNYLLEDGKPRNWFFLRANFLNSYRDYLYDRVKDWNFGYENTIFALNQIEYPRTAMLLPQRGLDDKALGRIEKHAGNLIELSAATKAQLFSQSLTQMVVVYPCRKAGSFVLTAIMDFRDLRQKVYRQEMMLAIVLVFLCVPVFYTVRFVCSYLVTPLLQIESGLKKVAEDDFSVPIRLSRHDEIGELSDAFDKMVDGIIERRNLGRFVSAGLDTKISQESTLGEDRLEKGSGAILCSDIRSFTTMSETFPVKEIVSMLNEHLSIMSRVIVQNGGLVEQFIGDAIVAVFTGKNEEEAANKAVQAGIAMIGQHRKLNEKRRLEGLFAYRIGIGIEIGQTVSGSVRAGEKREYVLIGHCRSRAEELESRSRDSRYTAIICSEKVRSLVKEVRFARHIDNENWEVIEAVKKK